MELLFSCGFAQLSGYIHTKQLPTLTDTMQLDTLSIVPGTVTLSSSGGKLLDSTYYKISYSEGKIYFNVKKMKEVGLFDSGIISSYKTFPYLFSEVTKHKDISRVKPDLFGNANPFNYAIESKNDDIFKMDGLNKSGSISRGFTVGNNQDMVVNSNLNLQLSGHLNNNIDILMAATDNNIPIQAEGNTQQLQEFDKVFIQLSTSTSKLIAGDFQLTRPTGYFMNFNKKAQGVSFSTAIKTNENNKNKAKQGIYKTSLSAAVSRGKFAKNQIQGIESNQGPYRLKGAENESFIIILSGSEKVYIDGRLLVRGQENDYTINYNTAELTFTAKQFITKDKRIVVEFQYSDKNYARSLVHFGNDYEQNKLKVHLHVYSEQDSKNQPLQQSLSDDDKKMLSDIGDSISHALKPSFAVVPFTNTEILYKMIDTVLGAYLYKGVFVYDTDTINHKTHYRVSFSNVGAGKGHYNQITTSANGKVFQWVPPSANGDTLHGSYEPLSLLITPKKKQMITAGVEYAINKNTNFALEAAVSDNDINTFSSHDKQNDVGYALKMNIDNRLPLSHNNNTTDTANRGVLLITNANYEYVQKYFSPIERYRSLEFERDWNRGSDAVADDQHIIGAGIGLAKRNLGIVGYKFNAFLEGTKYNAYKNNANFAISKKGFSVMYDGSILTSKRTIINTNFYRHKSGISQKIKRITIGVKDEFEQNKFSIGKSDSLLSNSYKFWEWQAFAQNADTTKTKYGINYKERTDYLVKDTLGNASFFKSTLGQNYSGFFELMKNPNSQLKLNATYRKLTIEPHSFTSQQPDNSLVGRIEYGFKLFKGQLSSSSFYEIGSGLEVKKEYSFIKVDPGLGIYMWIDYNHDGIKSLNEFEVAPTPSQGEYIKVFTPSNSYFKTYNNQFSEVLTLKPTTAWESKEGFRKFVSHFTNQTSYRVDRKSTNDILEIAYNPFLGLVNPIKLADSTIKTLNSSFRNTLTINQQSSVFGVDLSYQDTKNKSLTVNGLEARQNTFEEARVRWNIIQQISYNFDGINGIKNNNSQGFVSRNFSINYYSLEPKLNYQPTTSFRLSVLFKYTGKTDDRTNTDSTSVMATMQDYGAEVKYNVLNKGSLNFKADFIQIRYSGYQNTALAFEMLDALKTGQNITWALTYQRNITANLQLSITYDGRKSEGNKAIHIGGAQLRAYF